MKQKNNINPLNYAAKKYNNYIFDATTKYQKQYGFDIGTGAHATWNNEADAFKHTYMQAQLALWAGKHAAKFAGDFHEWQGNKDMGQSKGEENMDKWNNAQGREIAKEIILEYGAGATVPSRKINDIIARKVMERMRSGKLITTPNDTRIYEEGVITGNAAPIQQSFTREQIGSMTPDEFQENLPLIEQQLKDGLIKPQAQDYSGYLNPVSGNSKLFSRELISQMSGDEYTANESAIMAQLQAIGIPTDNELETASLRCGTVYVKPYARADGTEVRGYYRSV